MTRPIFQSFNFVGMPAHQDCLNPQRAGPFGNSIAAPIRQQHISNDKLTRAGRQQSQRLPNRLYAIRFMTGVLDQVT